MSREMKDSGVEWLGEIPKGWNVKKGKALYSITTGKLDANAEEPTGIYPFFTCSMFPKKINQYAFDCEALLVAGNGVVGFTQYYKGKFNAYQRTYVLSDFHNIYPLFLKYYVSNNLKREVEQSSVGSVIQFIKLGDLQNFNIAFPEYKEQEKITEYLEMKCQKIDHIIEKTKSSIVEYKKFKQSIITKAVTQGISNEQALKESGVAWIGNIPESWKFTQLRHCVSIRSGITLGKKYSKDIKLIEIPYLRVANVQDGYVDTNDIAVLRVSKDEIEKYSLSAGEVLIGDILNTELMLNNDAVKTQITVAGDGNTDEKKIYSLLEKLDLNIQKDSVSNYGNVGLGTSNLMSMACEMLLNQDNNELSTFMLIEEPEAHIHAQRQLKLIQSMQKKGENQQVIMTTHSPLLASVVELNNLLLIQNRKAFSMREGETMLDSSDYKFLERYLDATKANLFFAKGVIIVEGPGEALLLPTLAQLLNRNLTDYGISIVDVKSTGLRRYARIFQRKEGDEINIPVSCITDRDVMPECAPAICLDEKYKDKENWPKKNRKWKVESEIKDKEKYIQEIEKKANGQNVKTFIPEQWTLEYELAANGLGEEMLQTIATMLAEKIQDKEKNEEKKAELLEKYTKEYNEYKSKEAKASYVYSFFSHKIVSKAEFAQKFSFDLENIFKGKTVEEIVTVLPNYLVKAIEYVTTNIEGI